MNQSDSAPAHIVSPEEQARSAIPLGTIYRPDIDGLRAIAILLVLGFHAEIGALRGGFIGVDVFFVVSGYLITGIVLNSLEKGTFRYTDFYVRRINRIFPALLAVLIATGIVGWVVLFPNEFATLGKHLLGGSTFISNLVLWKETGYFDSQNKPLLHLWSLAVEEQFYIVWPLFLALLWRRKGQIGLSIALVCMISFGVSLVASQAAQTNAAFYFPVTRFWEILAGGLLCYAERQRWLVGTKRELRLAASISGLLLILVALLAVDKSTPWPSQWAALPVLGTVLIIGAGADSLPNRVVLSNRTMVNVGLISYPLYLWHWPALVYGRILNQEQVPRVGRIGLLLISFVLAIATYWFIERPIRFGAHKKRSAKWLLCGIGLMAAFGVMFEVRLLPARLDDLYSTSVERAATDEAPGGTFNRLGTDIVVFELPGDPRRTVAFVGDSHITQYWPRFVKLSRDTSRKNPRILFLTYGGCPPLPEVNPRGLSWDGSPWRCPFFHERAMARVADPRVKSVVFGAYWETYLEQGSLYASRHSNARLTPTAPVTDSVFLEFEREVGALVRNGKHVFIVLSNPSSPAYNPHSMLPARLPWLVNKSMRTSINKGEFLQRSNGTMRRLREIAKRTGATVIDPVDFLCAETQCPTVSPGGEPIYRDDHHLRATYARDHASFMDMVLR